MYFTTTFSAERYFCMQSSFIPMRRQILSRYLYRPNIILQYSPLPILSSLYTAFSHTTDTAKVFISIMEGNTVIPTPKKTGLNHYRSITLVVSPHE